MQFTCTSYQKDAQGQPLTHLITHQRSWEPEEDISLLDENQNAYECTKLKVEVLSNHGGVKTVIAWLRLFAQKVQVHISRQPQETIQIIEDSGDYEIYPLSAPLRGPFIDATILDKHGSGSSWAVNNLNFVRADGSLFEPTLLAVNGDRNFSSSYTNMIRNSNWTFSWTLPAKFHLDLGSDEEVVSVRVRSTNSSYRPQHISVAEADPSTDLQAVEAAIADVKGFSYEFTKEDFDWILTKLDIFVPPLIDNTEFFDLLIHPVYEGLEPVFPFQADSDQISTIQAHWLSSHRGAPLFTKVPSGMAEFMRTSQDSAAQAAAQVQAKETSFTWNGGSTTWFSPGLFLWPNSHVTVTVLEGDPSKWKVQVGMHKDKLNSDREYMRYPWMVVDKALGAEPTSLHNCFGGVVYIVADGSSAAPLSLKVKVSGAVPIPKLTPDNTEDPGSWNPDLHPWTELETEHIILTLPTDTLVAQGFGRAKLDELMSFWDQVIAAQNELQINNNLRKERFVADLEISAGWMHSGYPIMLYESAYSQIYDVDDLKVNGSWGLFHELGHNRQQKRWTFSGYGEVTVNIFTLYVFEFVLGIPTTEHPRMDRYRDI